MKKKKIILICSCVIVVAALAVIGVLLLLKPVDIPAEKTSREKKQETDPSRLYLSMKKDYEFQPDDDLDFDGLTYAQESEYKTDHLDYDTDADGISDYDEVFLTHTEPSNDDTDDDGIMDGDELLAGLDPLNPKTDGKTVDGKREFSRTISVDDINLSVNGNAGIFDVAAERYKMPGTANIPGLLSDVYEFYTDNKFKSASLCIPYNSQLYSGETAANLSICQLTDEYELVKVKSVVDETNHTVTAELEHFSKYALCDTGKIYEDAVPQVMVVIDNSGSMYPVEMCEGSEENDVNFQRVKMVENLLTKSYDEVIYGLAKFTKDYTELAPLGSSEEELRKQLDGIRTNEETFNGTYIETSLMRALDNFSADDHEHRNFVLILTDGLSTEGSGLFNFAKYDKDDIIKRAKKRNVTIITMGLGSAPDKKFLNAIAEETGGIYIHSPNSFALQDAYTQITASLNYNLADLDNDGKNDSVLLADSGFSLERNAFPYNNYVVWSSDEKRDNGQCFGLAALSVLYCNGTVPSLMGIGSGEGTGFLELGRQYYAPGYALNNSFFADENGVINKENLSEYENATLNKMKEINSLPTEEKYECINGKMAFKREIAEEIEKMPFLTTDTKECVETYYQGEMYYCFSYLRVNLAGIELAALNTDEIREYMELSAIYRLYVWQLEDYVEERKKSLNSSSIERNIQEKTMDKLIEILREGRPVVISSRDHAIVGERLYRSLENPDEYTLMVYDNNDPSSEYKIRITRRKNKADLNITEWMNDYIYTAYDLDGVFVGKGKTVDLTFTDVITVMEDYKKEIMSK